MELARLYPRWVAAVVCHPQAFVQATQPAALLTVLRHGLLHRAALSDLFGTDLVGRIQVTWVLWLYSRGSKVILQGTVARGGSVASVTSLWSSANWFERELWEMLGVSVRGHPDLRRLLTDYGFVGAPLLRDFPVAGYVELRYSERSKRVISRAVNFVQEFRAFDFGSPWVS